VEKSKALPARFYRNPADIVERNQMDELGCKACRHATVIWGATRCDDVRNEIQKGVPHIGHRCKYYEERA
jgi:hypothetical protein